MVLLFIVFIFQSVLPGGGFLSCRFFFFHLKCLVTTVDTDFLFSPMELCSYAAIPFIMSPEVHTLFSNVSATSSECEGC